MDEQRKRLEPHQAEKLNQHRRKRRLKWTEVARRADMSPQNLLRIRNGEISISEDATEGLDSAFSWVSGQGIDNLLQDLEPVDQPARADVDPLRDEIEEKMWAIGKEGGLPEDHIWLRIDELRVLRARKARTEEERHGRDSA